MSYIHITTYDGDPEEYDRDPVSVGEVERETSYTDGEELMAVMKVLRLLDEGTHFDVRHERF